MLNYIEATSEKNVTNPDIATIHRFVEKLKNKVIPPTPPLLSQDAG